MVKVNAVSVIGLGKLGLCMAACFARAGYKVYGIDIDEVKIDRVNKGECPIDEPGLAGLIKRHKKNLIATYDYHFAIMNSQATFVVVATPSTIDGNFSNAQVEAAIIQIANVLKKKKGYHLVAITSTVSPGTMDSVVKPRLEELSGKTLGKNLGLAYNPEFIALGTVIRDFCHPDFILVGESDPRVGKVLTEIYHRVCVNKPVIACMNLVSAEIAKLSLNCYVTMKISFANTLAEVCEHVARAELDKITGALGHDHRIGPAYLRGGLGYGGPCFPRDNRAFVSFVKHLGFSTPLQQTVDEINRHQMKRMVNYLIPRIKRGEKVAILGVSYKPNTGVIEDSQAVDIASRIAAIGAAVYVFDPMAMEVTRKVYGDRFIYSQDIHECLKGARACVIFTAWDEIRRLKPAVFERLLSPKAFILDCWRLFPASAFKRVQYLEVGRHYD